MVSSPEGMPVTDAKATWLRREERAVLGLLLATALWGWSFTWVKAGGEEVNAALGQPPGSFPGPLLFLAWRFGLATVLWVVFAPGCRRGWTWASLKRGLFLGVLLWVPMVLQVFGLDRTTEAVSAFLTSLTVVFVPLAMTFVLRRPPQAGMWVAVGIASAGIWLMTGASPTGFGLGEVFGLGCAILFSAHLISLNEVMRVEAVGRMTIAQFGFIALASILLACAWPAGRAALSPSLAFDVWTTGFDAMDGTPAGILGSRVVGVNLLFTTVFSSIGAFGLVFRLQPRVTPTRAAITYLAEPVFAAAFAYLAVGRMLAPVAWAGALLILLANVAAEIVQRRRPSG